MSRLGFSVISIVVDVLVLLDVRVVNEVAVLTASAGYGRCDH